MQWLKAAIQRWSAEKRGRDLDDFIEMIRGMDYSEVALVLLLANDFRLRFSVAGGRDLHSPAEVLASDPLACLHANHAITKFQKQRAFHDAAGVMVWLHTLRSIEEPRLRARGRILWTELAKSFDRLDQAASAYLKDTGRELYRSGAEIIPEGLEPKS
jgi:hypothetical protein